MKLVLPKNANDTACDRNGETKDNEAHGNEKILLVL